jgi:DNA-directed RNA polymerase subunit H (RpoH/RPB5)
MDVTNDVVRTFITVKEMLSDRKIEIENLDSISDKELTVMSKKFNIFSLEVSQNFKIIYYLNNKFKINDLKKFIEDNDKIIIVFKEKINNLNIKNLKELNVIGLETFTIKELLFNISKHELVPKHEIIKEDEVKEMMNIYQIKQKSQLPIILRTDPMAKYLDVKSGDVVKVTRISPSAGETIVYRYCV